MNKRLVLVFSLHVLCFLLAEQLYAERIYNKKLTIELQELRTEKLKHEKHDKLCMFI